jgi:S1-C subfamily serine protease
MVAAGPVPGSRTRELPVNPLVAYRPAWKPRTLAKVDRAGAPLVADSPDEQAEGQPHAATRRRRSRWLATALAVLAVLLVGTFALTRGPDTPPITKGDVDRAVERGMAEAQKQARQATPDAATAYRVALPSMVTIAAQRTSVQGVKEGTGAGVVISRDGSILTALHVVGGAARIQVKFADGTDSTATIADQQPASDIAVLTPHRLPQVVVPAVMGGGAQVGDPVFALGHPLGLTESLSAGVVSAVDRSIRVKSDQVLDGLIQFDAAVNPGNSGGPLLNRDGQVVGIVTGLANPSEQNFFVGISFAVPIATAGGVAGSPPQ